RARLRDDVRFESMTFDPSGRRLLTTGAGSAVAVWCFDGLMRVAPPIPAGMIASVAWSPDGLRFATGSRDGVLGVWDAQTGLALLSARVADGPVDRVLFVDDGVAARSGTLVTVWDA